MLAASPALAGPSDPDGSFGSSGLVVENLGSIEAGGIVLQLSTDKLLLLGGGSGTAAGHSLTRYDAGGTKDSGYGTSGTAAGHSGTIWGATLLPGDRVLVAGDRDMGNLTDLNDASVMRYTAAGAKDGTFGTDGRVTFRFDPDTARDEHATSAIVLKSGKILVGGYFWKGGSDFDIAAVRLTSTGEVDTTFAGDGYFSFDFKGGLDKAWRVLELPDKKILVYGEVEDKAAAGQPSKVFFLRLTEDGEIDTTFGGGGTGYATVLTDVNSDLPGTLVRLPSGKFLFSILGTALWTAGRLTEDGVPDADFGTAGIAKLTPVFPNHLFPVATPVGLAVQGDGRFVLGGWVSGLTAQFALKYEVGLARFEEDGTPDTTFHSGSAQRIYTVTTTGIETVSSLIVQRDGAIVLGGSYTSGGDDRFMLRVEGDAPGDTTTTTTSTTTTTLDVLCGDANGDGRITSSDALKVLRAAVSGVACPLVACDATGDGKLTSSDALRVLRYAVGASVAMNCAS